MSPSAADVVRIAFEHTKEQLFRPFRLGQWTRLAVTGFLAGEMGSAGGCGYQIPSMPRGNTGSENFLAQAFPAVNVLLVVAVACLILAAVILLVALLYVSSMMRFVLFDSVVAKECHIRRFWKQRLDPGFRYFVWQILFMVTVVGGISILLGAGAALVFGFGWHRNPGQHLLPLILGGIVFFGAFAVFLILAFLVSVLTKDFVVPQMALENVGVVDGWRRLWDMLKAEKGGYAGYVGLKILLSLGAAMALGLTIVVSLLVFLLPIGVVGLIGFLAARVLGFVWNLYTISLTVIAGGATLVVMLYGFSLLTVPVIVFFPAYSIHFFAPRYPALNTILYPPGPPSGIPEVS